MIKEFEELLNTLHTKEEKKQYPHYKESIKGKNKSY